MMPFTADLKKLASTGGSIVFAVGWFLKEDTGERVEWNTLARMAEACIGFDFYVYVPDRGESDEVDVS